MIGFAQVLSEDLLSTFWEIHLEPLSPEWKGKSWGDLDPEVREYWRKVLRRIGSLVLYRLQEV